MDAGMELLLDGRIKRERVYGTLKGTDFIASNAFYDASTLTCISKYGLLQTHVAFSKTPFLV